MTTASVVESEIALLQERREGLGLSREDLSELLDVHPNTVARWERGNTVTLSDWVRWRQALGLDVPMSEDKALRDRWREKIRDRSRSAKKSRKIDRS